MNLETVIATNRFGLGARPGELRRVGSTPRHWLKDQLDGPARISHAIRDLEPTSTILPAFQDAREMRRSARRDAAERDESATADVPKIGGMLRRYYLAQTGARYRHAATTDQPFLDRLVHFWTNHFAVSADKQPLPALAGMLENEAVRPNVTGRFADLLLAVEQHPAMLLYLDNERSIGPNSKLANRAKRRQRNVGLNENLAREILELHTLGVDGGYAQSDVTNLAKIITGWSIGGGRQRGLRQGTPGTFEFRDNIHEPGPHELLGHMYRERGVAQGVAALEALAVHPSTAKHLATKLARHFVSDDPSKTLVDMLADVYLETGGDLSAVYIALIDADEPWQSVATKYKSPHDFVISTYRAFDFEPNDGRMTVAALDMMGQPPFRPGSPAGWPDTAEEWGGADALYKRIEWADRAAHRVGGRANPLALSQSALGPALSPATRRAIEGAESAIQGTTLLLASPDFQRR